MYGTLAKALAVRNVDFDRDQYVADVDGTIDGPTNKTIRISKIHVTYHLNIPADQRTEAERALRVHPAGCPAHESVKDAIEITWDADITER